MTALFRHDDYMAAGGKIGECRPVSATAVARMVPATSALVTSLEVSGVLRCVSHMMRRGFLPFGNTAGHSGSSASTVPTPTIMATFLWRSRCTRSSAASLVIHRDTPLSSSFFAIQGHGVFHGHLGRFCLDKVEKSPVERSHSSRRTPLSPQYHVHAKFLSLSRRPMGLDLLSRSPPVEYRFLEWHRCKAVFYRDGSKAPASHKASRRLGFPYRRPEHCAPRAILRIFRDNPALSCFRPLQSLPPP